MSENHKLVFSFPGFGDFDASGHLDRLEYFLSKTSDLWSCDLERSDEIVDEPVAITNFDAKSSTWDAKCRFVQFSWANIIRHYHSKASFKTKASNVFKYLRLLMDGTLIKYLGSSGRYFAFTLYPIIAILVFILLAFVASSFAIGLLGLGQNVDFWLVLGATIVTSGILIFYLGKKLFIPLSIDCWGFASDLAKHSHPQSTQLLETYANTMVSEIKQSDHDEIVIFALSLGGSWATSALAIALRKCPDLLVGKKLTIMMFGSSVLKIAFMPKASAHRKDMAFLAQQENLFWYELASKDDAICFYKVNPFKAIRQDDPVGGILLDRVNYKHAMDIKRYRKMKKSFYRTHLQYTFYMDKRTEYDFLFRMISPLKFYEIENKHGDIKEFMG